MSEYASHFGFSIEVSSDPKSVKNKSGYDAFLLVESKKFENFASFLNPESCNVVFSNKHPTSKEFRQLRADASVTYLLEQPIVKTEIVALLRTLCSPGQAEEIDLPPELMEKYTSTLSEKIEELEGLVQKIHAHGGEKKPLVDLRNVVHKIAGSAGGYGFTEAGKLCKQQELYLQGLYGGETITISPKEIDTANVKFLRALRLNFQKLCLQEPKVRENKIPTKPSSPVTKTPAQVQTPSTKISLLCFDEAHKLRPVLDEYANLLRFSYQSVTNVEQLEKQYSQKNYDGVLIVEGPQLSDPKQLIERLSQNKHSPLALIADKCRKAEVFRELKTKYAVDYVLEQPVIKEEFLALLRQLCHMNGQSHRDEESLPKELIEKYTSSIYDKIERIEELIQASHANSGEKEPLATLRNEVHKIAGSAGGYGFSEAGQLCKMHELYLQEIYSSEPIITPQKEIDAANVKFLRKLRLNFQKLTIKTIADISTQIKKSASAQEQKTRPLSNIFLVLISTDLNIIRIFQKLAKRYHLAFEVESDPQHFLDKWEDINTPPFTIIVEEHYPFTTYTGQSLFKLLREKWKEVSPTFGIMTQSDELDKRIEWIAEGIDLVLKNPLQSRISSIFLSNSAHKKRCTISKL